MRSQAQPHFDGGRAPVGIQRIADAVSSDDTGVTMGAPIPANEEARLETLKKYQILDTAAEKVFDDITALAADVCHTPFAFLSFVDRDRQWFKSNVGLPARETNRDIAFCAHAIMDDD